MMTDEEFRREERWRALAQDLFMRLNECHPFKLGNVTALPKLPSDDELKDFAERFRKLSEEGGWTSRRRLKQRWWWPFGSRA